MSENFALGNVPQLNNPTRVILVKTLNALNSGAGGGGSADSQGVGAPVAPPANTAATSTYYDTSTGTAYFWNTTTQAWQ